MMDLEIMMPERKAGDSAETPSIRRYTHEEKAIMAVKEAFMSGYLIGHRMGLMGEYDSEGAYNEWNTENVRPRG